MDGKNPGQILLILLRSISGYAAFTSHEFDSILDCYNNAKG